MAGIEKEIAQLWQDIGSTKAKATASHQRLDRLEQQTREDFKEIGQSLQSILNKIGDLKLKYEKDRSFVLGIVAVASLLGSVLGSIIPTVIQSILR